MNFIKKVFEGKTDELVHLQFQKFSRGEFQNRAIIKAKQGNGKFTISTTYEFANDLVRETAEKLGESMTKVSGAIVSTSDLTGKLKFKEKKQFQGVKRYLIDCEMSGREIMDLLNKFPKAFFALSFEAGDTKLKIKPKAPKSAKPKNKEDAPKPGFCKLVTNDGSLGQSFVFEKSSFKEASINHSYFIEEIIIPEELKSEKDFAKVREEGKRKGRILRKGEIDGQPFEREIEFLA